MSLAFRDQNDEIRFLSKIEKRMDGCWSWKADLSRKFNISPSVIGGVIEGGSWKHV